MANTKKQLPKGVKLKKGEELLHYHKFCYCVVKYSNLSAVFAIPPQKKGTVTDCGYVNVCFDKNLENVKVGDWCEIGYISQFESGTNRILSINKIHKEQ
jgi:hypothetical protein